jgi:hypothetical protein
METAFPNFVDHSCVQVKEHLLATRSIILHCAFNLISAQGSYSTSASLAEQGMQIMALTSRTLFQLKFNEIVQFRLGKMNTKQSNMDRRRVHGLLESRFSQVVSNLSFD